VVPERQVSSERLILSRLGDVHVRALWQPEDTAAFLRFGAALAPEDLRLRFGVPSRWGAVLAARLWRRDGTDFAAFDPAGEILGIGNLIGNEIALAIRSDRKRRGLGRLLLGRLVRFAGDNGICELLASVLAENFPMLALARSEGFRAVGIAGPMVSLQLPLARRAAPAFGGAAPAALERTP
jgi:acetyltransferase